MKLVEIPMTKIAILISGNGSNLQAIIDACESGNIDGEMAFVGSDNPDAKGLVRSRNHGIPNFVVDYGKTIREYRTDQTKMRLPEDFDFTEIMSKQSLFSNDESPEKLEAFFSSRAISQHEEIFNC